MGITSASNAIIVELTNSTGFPRRYAVADNVGISKGAPLTLVDARTASGALAQSASISTAFAGIAAMEKEANDGSTSITAWTDGIFEVTASGAISIGQPIVFIAGNFAAGATTGASGAYVAGYALETASDAEQINVRINI